MKSIHKRSCKVLLCLVSALLLQNFSVRAELTDGLVAYWAFDDNYDEPVGGFTGEPRGTNPVAFTDSTAGFGRAILLDGEDQFVEITGGSEDDLEFPGGDVSIAGWFRVDAFDTSWQALISKGEGNAYRVARRDAGNILAYAGGAADTPVAGPNVNDGGWHHFVAISDTAAANTRLYIDGTLAATQEAAPALNQNNLNLYIGENPGAAGRQWEGAIDEVAIWNRVLNTDEITALLTTKLDSILFPNPAVRFAGQESREDGITIELRDQPGAVFPIGNFTLSIDGVEAAEGSVTAEKAGSLSTINYSTAPGLFPSASEHTWLIEFSGTESLEGAFTTPTYAVVDPAFIAQGVDTGMGGFRIFAYQTQSQRPNRVFEAERALLGEYGANIADLTVGPDLNRDGFGDIVANVGTAGFVDSTVINYDSSALTASGIFQDPNFADPVLSDGTVPGILSGLASADANRNYSNHEITTYIDFPAAGIYEMGVNANDGFKVSVAGSNRDTLGQILGFRDAGGAGNTTFRFLIQEAGIYPVRLLWYQGTGGAFVEWYRVLEDGTQVLINDRASTGALFAYHSKSGGERARVTSAPGLNALLNGGNLRPDTTYEVTLEDGTTTVDETSVSFTFNGSADGVTVNKTGTTTTVSFAPEGLLPSGAEVSIDFSWAETGGATTSVSLAANVSSYAIVQSFRTDLGTGGAPGMNWRIRQQEAALTLSTQGAEALLAGTGPNLANLTNADDGDTFYIDFVNFEQGAGNAGQFAGNSAIVNQQVQDALFPGIPGNATNTTDNFAVEITTFIEFTEAGLYEMVSNTDDGFRTTIATDETTADGTVESLTSPDALELGVFSGGRGPADSVYFFSVPEPGIYPFRQIYYEGGGGSAAEWFVVNADGTRALINGTQPGALKAYRTRSGTPSDFVSAGTGEEASISIAGNGDGSFTLTWEGTLLGSETVDGTYNPVAGTSPMVVTPAGMSQFYQSQSE